MYSNLTVSSLLKLDTLEKYLYIGASSLHKIADIADLAHKSLHSFNKVIDNGQFPIFSIYNEYSYHHDEQTSYYLNNTSFD